MEIKAPSSLSEGKPDLNEAINFFIGLCGVMREAFHADDLEALTQDQRIDVIAIAKVLEREGHVRARDEIRHDILQYQIPVLQVILGYCSDHKAEFADFDAVAAEVRANLSAPEADSSTRITEMRGPEEQKADGEQRKERLILIYSVATELRTLLSQMDIVDTARLNYSLALPRNSDHTYSAPLQNSSVARQERVTRFMEVVGLGADLGFINRSEFLASAKNEAMANLAELIGGIEQRIPELAMQNLAKKVAAVLDKENNQ